MLVGVLCASQVTWERLRKGAEWESKSSRWGRVSFFKCLSQNWLMTCDPQQDEQGAPALLIKMESRDLVVARWGHLPDTSFPGQPKTHRIRNPGAYWVQTECPLRCYAFMDLKEKENTVT